jgi:hypothetical protein
MTWRSGKRFRRSAETSYESALLGAFRLSRSALLKQGKSRGCNPHNAAFLHLLFHNQSAIVRFFPNRQSGARRAPCFHHFFIASIASCQPLKKIQDQALGYEVHDFRQEGWSLCPCLSK